MHGFVHPWGVLAWLVGTGLKLAVQRHLLHLPAAPTHPNSAASALGLRPVSPDWERLVSLWWVPAASPESGAPVLSVYPLVVSVHHNDQLTGRLGFHIYRFYSHI